MHWALSPLFTETTVHQHLSVICSYQTKLVNWNMYIHTQTCVWWFRTRWCRWKLIYLLVWWQTTYQEIKNTSHKHLSTQASWQWKGCSENEPLYMTGIYSAATPFRLMALLNKIRVLISVRCIKLILAVPVAVKSCMSNEIDTSVYNFQNKTISEQTNRSFLWILT